MKLFSFSNLLPKSHYSIKPSTHERDLLSQPSREANFSLAAVCTYDDHMVIEMIVQKMLTLGDCLLRRCWVAAFLA